MPSPFWVLGLMAAAEGTKPGLGQMSMEVSWDPAWAADTGSATPFSRWPYHPFADSLGFNPCSLLG